MLDGEAQLPGGMVLTEREWAASILERVAEAGRHGLYPDDISLFDLGRALSRTCINASISSFEPGNGAGRLNEIVRGWEHVDRRRH